MANKIKLNKLQEIKIKEINVLNKIMENVEFSFSKTQYRHKLTGEITTEIDIMKMNEYEEVGKEEREEREKKSKQNLAKLNYHYSKEEGLI